MVLRISSAEFAIRFGAFGVRQDGGGKGFRFRQNLLEVSEDEFRQTHFFSATQAMNGIISKPAAQGFGVARLNEPLNIRH